MAAKIGRNDPCTCGSGKKFKNCCGLSGLPLKSKKLNQTLAGIVISALLVVVASAYVQLGQDEQVPDEPPITVIPGSYAPSRDFKPGPQPPGEVPRGMIWNKEHGHWHKAPGESSPQQAQDPKTVPLASSEGYTPGPQPPGEVPEGKVWSAEHGHWHNEGDNSEHAVSAPSDVPTSPQPSPQHKWSKEHGHWHGPPTQEEMDKASKANKLSRIQQSLDNEQPQLEVTPVQTAPKDSL